jgi:hypothetical protein
VIDAPSTQTIFNRISSSLYARAGVGLKVKISIKKSKVPWEELMEVARKDASDFLEMELGWKIWLFDIEEGLVGGIYYFEDEESFQKSMGRALR